MDFDRENMYRHQSKTRFFFIHVYPRRNFISFLNSPLISFKYVQAIFSDEKKITLDRPDGLSSSWHEHRKKPKYSSKKISEAINAWGPLVHKELFHCPSYHRKWTSKHIKSWFTMFLYLIYVVSDEILASLNKIIYW